MRLPELVVHTMEQHDAATKLSRAVKDCADLRGNDAVRDALRTFDNVAQGGETCSKLLVFNVVHADAPTRTVTSSLCCVWFTVHSLFRVVSTDSVGNDQNWRNQENPPATIILRQHNLRPPSRRASQVL
jgi:hypothetical protein